MEQSKTEEDLSMTKQQMTSMANVQNTLEAQLQSVRTTVNTLPSVNSRLDSIEQRQRVLDTDVAGIKDTQKNVLVELKQMQNDILQFKLRSNEEDKTELSHQQKIAYLKKKAEFQCSLCNLYDTYLSTIPVSPVLEEIDARIEDIYVALTITDDLVRQEEQDFWTVPREVNGYADILTKNDKPCKNVYVIGDAGIGKTTWCLKVLRSWSLSLKKIATTMPANENFISENFDIVLFVSLRLASTDYNICDMIQSQLFEEYPSMYESALEIMRKEPERCLLICDGLDEWIPQQSVVERSPLYAADLLGRKDLNGAIIVTTTRPWKLDHIRLSDKHIDRSVTIEGFSTHRKVVTLATKIIEHLNMKNSETSIISREITDFETDLKTVFRLDTGNKKPTI
ncbi:uncharacterized protein LOC123528662 [Mercenaria mercenaria]|uniref:uncharacterized protein LOC123528662 n=1 Tax=Mercenaria mercenaria TaxID=6596 RepID=UPI00234F5B05|nr:uncharacterized protein LOC123528662 [Mercenaria mercenaria]XP_053378432.1 uncharacterized protein LOC123528662 [Mercenaria mercenaria]